MKIKEKLNQLVFLTVAGVFIVGLAGDAFAQGRYSGRYSRGDVDNIIRQMEQNSDEFRTDFRNEMNRSNMSSSQRNRYNGYVASCEDAIDDLRRHFDRNDSWWESRSRVQTVVNASRNVDTMMRALSFRRNLERQWNRLRNEINRVADTYDLPGLNGGGWQGGGNWNPGFPGGGGNSGWNGRYSSPPSWMRGTFHSSYPRITLTVENNGRVSVINQGQTFYGGYYNGRLYVNDDASTVSRTGNGIRTYNINTGATTDYSRGFDGGGNDYDSNGPTSTPPSWAVGTFYSQGGQGITLTIQRNGRITVVNQGQSYYGRYYAGQIYLNNDVSSVNRSGNGISTYNRNTGQTTNYSRRRY